MGRRLVLLFWFLVGFVFSAAAGGREEWPPITDADRALKDCASLPGAPAVYLLTTQTTNHDKWTFHSFARIKVLTPAGREYGDLEVPFSEVWEVQSIEARVVQPDGRVEPFTGPVHEKTLVRLGPVSRMVKTLALPGVEVGSIIDYRYDLKFNWKKAKSLRGLRLERWKPEEGGIPTDTRFLATAVELWDFDWPLFVYKARFTYLLSYGQIGLGDAHLKMSFVSFGLPWGPPLMSTGRVELEVENIPPRPKEDWMAPEEEDRMGVIFFLCDTRVEDVDSYWRLESSNWQNAALRFMRAERMVDSESRTLTAGTMEPLGMLKALYDRAQRIQNLSYVRDPAPGGKKGTKVKANQSASDVLTRNAGLRSDITRTFVALAQGAGFEADLVRVVARDDKFFNRSVLDLYGQFDTELAVVTMNGRETFFDPATPWCPMGLVHWRSTDAPSLRASGPAGRIERTPLDPPERSRSEARFALKLSSEGDLAGTAIVTCTGQEALRLRLEHLSDDEAGIKKGLETRMAGFLPEGARVSLRAVGNLAATEDNVRLEYDVSLPGAAVSAGGRTVLPAVPLRPVWRDSFRHASRKSSIYFPYLATDAVEIEITLPDDLTIEMAPEPARAERSFARYSLTATAEGAAKVLVRRETVLLKYRIASNLYSSVKSFFDQVRAGDEAQIVLSPRDRMARPGFVNRRDN